MDIDGEKLRQLRDAKVWTLRRLKEESGVAADTIHDLEHGRRRAKQTTIIKLAEALDVDPGALLKGGANDER